MEESEEERFEEQWRSLPNEEHARRENVTYAEHLQFLSSQRVLTLWILDHDCSRIRREIEGVEELERLHILKASATEHRPVTLVQLPQLSRYQKLQSQIDRLEFCSELDTEIMVLVAEEQSARKTLQLALQSELRHTHTECTSLTHQLAEQANSTTLSNPSDDTQENSRNFTHLLHSLLQEEWDCRDLLEEDEDCVFDDILEWEFQSHRICELHTQERRERTKALFQYQYTVCNLIKHQERLTQQYQQHLSRNQNITTMESSCGDEHETQEQQSSSCSSFHLSQEISCNSPIATNNPPTVEWESHMYRYSTTSTAQRPTSAGSICSSDQGLSSISSSTEGSFVHDGVFTVQPVMQQKKKASKLPLKNVSFLPSIPAAPAAVKTSLNADQCVGSKKALGKKKKQLSAACDQMLDALEGIFDGHNKLPPIVC